MKRYIPSLLITVCAFLAINTARANNIEVSNCGLTSQNTTAGLNNPANFTQVRFNVSWENSWRVSSAPNNWDAAWVFVKYRVQPSEVWQHAYLNPTGHNTGTGTATSIQVGLVDESLPHNGSTNPAVGAFVFRSNNGSGTFNTTDIQLRWNYAAQGVNDDDIVDIQVYAVEMVFIPEGSFFLGDEGGGTGMLSAGGTSSLPYQVTSENAITISNTLGNLFGVNGVNANSTSISNTAWTYTYSTGSGTIPASFPKGFQGFYSMKYEVSQQQYVDYLNALNSTQQSARAYVGGANRNGISLGGGVYTTSTPFVANNFMSWADGVCFADWTGLRPMTELEFEKAARGVSNSIPDEYAWGNTAITQSQGISNAGSDNETAINAAANATYGPHASVSGPIRVGSHAQSGTSRVDAGASYYGIMELSGNLWERCVTIGRPEGKAYTGIHGNGEVTALGSADVANWPADDALGGGFKGGGWDSAAALLRTSDRTRARYTHNARDRGYGFRAVRTAPTSPIN